MPSLFVNSMVNQQTNTPLRPTPQITADFLMGKSRHADGAIASNFTDAFRRSMTAGG